MNSRTLVLVPGAWLGSWYWSRVTPMLWAGGLRVVTLALTGVGERAHLMSPDIGPDTHVDDVVRVIEMGADEPVSLLGHSYGGFVIEAVAARRPDIVDQLVFLDAPRPLPGESILDSDGGVRRKQFE